MKNPNLEKTQEVTLVRPPPPPVLRWDWNGDRVLLLYRDDALVVELRKKTEAGVSWHLHHPNGAVVLAGRLGGSPRTVHSGPRKRLPAGRRLRHE